MKRKSIKELMMIATNKIKSDYHCEELDCDGCPYCIDIYNDDATEIADFDYICERVKKINKLIKESQND